MDPQDLQRLADAKEEHSTIVAVLAGHTSAAPALPDVVRYLPCPACGKMMNRSNFAKSSGVVLDVCRDHGVWLDRGELPALLDFIGTGGLARARARDHLLLEEERRRIEALRGMGSGAHVAHDTGSFPLVSDHSKGTIVFSRILRTLFSTISE